MVWKYDGGWVSWEAEVIFRFAHEPVAVAVPCGSPGGAADCRSRPHHLSCARVSSGAPCPECTRPSYRIHSYFEPRLAELPWNRIPVKIRLRTRRFFRDTEDCAQRIFTERLPETTEAYARRTLRMEQALRWLALALGNLDHGDPEMLLFSMTRFFKFLPGEQRQAFLRGLSEKAS